MEIQKRANSSNIQKSAINRFILGVGLALDYVSAANPSLIARVDCSVSRTSPRFGRVRQNLCHSQTLPRIDRHLPSVLSVDLDNYHLTVLSSPAHPNLLAQVVWMCGILSLAY